MRQALDVMAKHWVWLVLALVGVQIVTLVLMGQPWICPCGDIKLWASARIVGESSQHIADWYTPSHVLHGVLFYWLIWWVSGKRGWNLSVGVRLMLAVLLEVSWEIAENTPFVIDHYRTATAAVDYAGDTIINSFFDTIWMALGFGMAWKLRVKWVIAIAVIFELVALIAVRDNLFLNVMTFLWPMESVVDWQSGADSDISAHSER